MRAQFRDEASGQWFAYERPLTVLTAHATSDVAPLLDQVTRSVNERGCHAAGFVAFEAAPAFDAGLPVLPPDGLVPLACFGLYETRRPLNTPVPGDQPAPLPRWGLTLDEPSYRSSVAAIQDGIRRGDFYQVNFCAQFTADTTALDTRFCLDAPFGAILDHPDFSIVSASPELFFRLTDGLVTSRPMKGTAARAAHADEDERVRAWLAASEKNRAENLMITDMVRNDLGRIAQPGTVRATEIFAVNPFPTVWQMTSTVSARTTATLPDVFRALFPPASITGAPKRAAMACIAEYEAGPRGVYTGALGVVTPDGNATFSVAIRTAVHHKATHRAVYGAGGGIVADSSPREEFGEMHLKAQVLQRSTPQFELLETLRIRNGRVHLLELHLHRLAGSAAHHGFCCDVSRIAAALKAAARGQDDGRVRLTLNADGTPEISVTPVPASAPITQLALYNEPVDKADPSLRHKTTARTVYERAAVAVGSDREALLVNDDGCITESAIANVVYELDGRLFTPPADDGLLPGIQRQHLLALGIVAERSLTVAEAGRVSRWYLVNALRGWRRARLGAADQGEAALTPVPAR